MNQFFDVIQDLFKKLETQKDAVEQAGQATAKALMNKGIIQAFGSGHSMGGAMEVTTRAGGFIPSKMLKDFSIGTYEMIEGVGTQFMRKVDVRENDVVFIISNSGRNPLGVEIATIAKEKGATTIAVTSLEASKNLTSKHSSGKRLFEVCDIVLDNCAPDGDAAIELAGLDSKVCGVSAITCNMLLQSAMLRAAEIMLENGVEPPVYKSANVDGGPEYNQKLEAMFFDRIFHV